MRELPNGWKWKRIQDISDRSNPYSVGDGDHGQIKPSMYLKDGIPYIRVNNIRNSTINTQKIVYISAQTHAENPKSHLLPDDIVIAKTGATIGRTAIIPNNMKQANTTSSVGKITVDKSQVMPRYLLYYLDSPEFQQEMWKVSHKSAQPGFNIIDLKNFLVPVPSPPIQKRIVAILERAQKLRKLRETANLMTNKILQAVFLQMFGDPISNEKGWKMGVVGEVTNSHDNKRIPLRKSDRKKKQGEYPYYGASGIIDYVNEYIFDFESVLLGEDGANLISRSTPIAFIASGKYWVNNHAHVLTANELTNNEFLAQFFNTINLKPYVSGSAQPKLTAKLLNSIPIPIPPIEEQGKFSQVTGKVRTLNQKQEQSTKEMTELFNSLVSKAFKGDLALEAKQD